MMGAHFSLALVLYQRLVAYKNELLKIGIFDYHHLKIDWNRFFLLFFFWFGLVWFGLILSKNTVS